MDGENRESAEPKAGAELLRLFEPAFAIVEAGSGWRSFFVFVAVRGVDDWLSLVARGVQSISTGGGA